jgi:hypothetical protein
MKNISELYAEGENCGISDEGIKELNGIKILRKTYNKKISKNSYY